LQPSPIPKVVDLPFDMFDLPNWCKIYTSTDKPVINKETALSNAAGVKLQTYATNSQTDEVITFTVHQLGWLGECSN